jgi:HD-like signal output (HDOD) protein
MKLLLVDDEVRVLEGLERMLNQIVDDDWEIHCASGGTAALEILARMPVDVMVTDMRMPGMNGAQLLAEVRRRYPEVARFVLSGHMEQETAMAAAVHAHQFLAKPCTGSMLRDAVLRAYRLRTRIVRDDIVRAVGTVERLPTVPSIYAELRRALDDPGISAADVAKIVRRDPALCAKTLQLVNSAFFGRTTTVVDVQTAVMRLGLLTMQSLVLSVAVFEAARQGAHGRCQLDLDALQSRCERAAGLAGRLTKDRDQAMMGAMLADVGILVMASTAPAKLELVQRQARSERRPVHELEQDLLGVTHAEVGAYLLGLWGLPLPVVEAVACHHRLGTADRPGMDTAVATHIACHLAEGLALDAEALAARGLTADRDAWLRKVEKAS